MGQVCFGPRGNNVDKKLVDADRAIDDGMKREVAKERQMKKLLLLGTGSSGKSTLFKNLKKIEGVSIDDAMRKETEGTLRNNLVHHMATLLKKSAELINKDPERYEGCKFPQTEETIQASELVLQYEKETFEEPLEPEVMIAIGKAVAFLWKQEFVQFTYANRGGVFNFPDNMDFFYDKSEEVMSLEFVPTDEDVLKNRIRTTGVVHFEYHKGDTTFLIFDVGGQRNERKKWIHQFDNVSAVIYVSALNHFNDVCFEDESVNAMHESLNVFEDICASKWFKKSEMILFFNKEDLFIDLLRNGVTLHECFSVEKMWDPNEPQWEGPDYKPLEDEEEDMKHFQECYHAAVDFIKETYVKKNQLPNRFVFNHVTCATDTGNVEKVFWDVQNMVIRGNLKKGGLMI